MRLALALVVLAGCGSDAERGPESCPEGRVEVDGGCETPPPQACPAGHWVTPMGTCVPAGLADELCGDGFEVTSEGCRPVLPIDVCAPGTMAAVGEDACRLIMECGSGPWGDLPVDTSTTYVDASYVGASDGSEAAPFTSILEAALAAPAGGLVAVAEGTYAEDLVLAQHPVRIWGRCPELVEVVGSGSEFATVLVTPGASGTEIGGLAITGPVIGVGVTGGELRVDRVWVHDTGGTGIDAVDDLGGAALTVVDTLVEGATGLGMRALRSSFAFERSMVRGTNALVADGLAGRGVSLHGATGSMSGMVIEDNRDTGLRAVGSTVEVAGVVIQRTQPLPDGQVGRGVLLGSIADTTEGTVMTMRNVAVLASHDVGVLVIGSELVADNLWVQGTLPELSNGTGGYGINVQVDVDQGGRSTAALTGAWVTQSHEAGVRVAGSHADLLGVRVDDTAPRPSNGRFGYRRHRGGDASEPGAGERGSGRQRDRAQHRGGAVRLRRQRHRRAPAGRRHGHQWRRQQRGRHRGAQPTDPLERDHPRLEGGEQPACGAFQLRRDGDGRRQRARLPGLRHRRRSLRRARLRLRRSRRQPLRLSGARRRVQGGVERVGAAQSVGLSPMDRGVTRRSGRRRVDRSKGAVRSASPRDPAPLRPRASSPRS